MPYFSKVQQGLCRGVLLLSAIYQALETRGGIHEKTPQRNHKLKLSVPRVCPNCSSIIIGAEIKYYKLF